MHLNIIVIDQDKTYFKSIKSSLSKISCNIVLCDDFEKAKSEISNSNNNILISDFDIWTNNITFNSFLSAYPNTEIIIVAKKPTYKDAGHALANGVLDYLDFENVSKLPIIINNLILQINSEKKIKKSLMSNYSLVSKNQEYKEMLYFCEKAANSNANILLVGESGTGKEVAAKYIHLHSQRNIKPFVAVNCSSFSDTLLESELFGYVQGAFTGATKSRVGRFELANKGTLFLDEIGDVNISTQVKLLRAIENKTIQRLGSNDEKIIDFRLISATNKNLKKEVLDNNFREDFFYRISTIVIRIPSLRERKEDLEDLINFFLLKAQEEHGIKIHSIDAEVKKFLYSYDYPGNIRELKNILDRMVIFSENGIITKSGIPLLFSVKKEQHGTISAFNEIIPYKDFKKQSESVYLEWVLKQTKGNVAEASRKLNISSRQLFNKINEYNIKK
jgi:DNA-binding NtrC family response regulator